MKQLIKAAGAKFKRSHSRIKQSQQNRMLVNNQGLFFHWLNNEGENQQCEIPSTVEAQTFWSGILSDGGTDILEGYMEWQEGALLRCWIVEGH